MDIASLTLPLSWDRLVNIRRIIDICYHLNNSTFIFITLCIIDCITFCILDFNDYLALLSRFYPKKWNKTINKRTG